VFILQEDEQVFGQAQAGSIIPFDKKHVFPSKHRHGD
jgi:hypothetical protein